MFKLVYTYEVENILGLLLKMSSFYTLNIEFYSNRHSAVFMQIVCVSL